MRTTIRPGAPSPDSQAEYTQAIRPCYPTFFEAALAFGGSPYTLLECIDAALELGHAFVDLGSSLKFKKKGKCVSNNPCHVGVTGPTTREERL